MNGINDPIISPLAIFAYAIFWIGYDIVATSMWRRNDPKKYEYLSRAQTMAWAMFLCGSSLWFVHAICGGAKP